MVATFFTKQDAMGYEEKKLNEYFFSFSIQNTLSQRTKN
jgi:hypothetical protein